MNMFNTTLLRVVAPCLALEAMALASCGWMPERVSSTTDEVRPDELRQGKAGPAEPTESRRDEAIGDAGRGSAVIHCDATPSGSKTIDIQYQIRNIGLEIIHIIDNGRVPYELIEDERTLVILHGLHPPPVNSTFMFGVPRTRPLAPGDVHAGKVTWPKRVTQDHYGPSVTPVTLRQGTIHVRCEAGWWHVPVTDPPPFVPYVQLRDSQQLVRYGPFDVTLP
jgi:hypothetical protein